ncbi:type III PLP-dependent enzyme [Actinosynnema pretiosum]|uniref:type III PLP-dependent enzyme n=1 Tax=Actinosynnema pretiosum TaxID=42197 RepID=UPI0015A705CF|nr:type III PLP-dependent enzyme [Actinosynnema pretiosum]
MTSLRDIADRYGTPAYVYRLDDVERAAAELVGQLPQPSSLCFSLKANPHPDVVAAARVAGCRAEVSSTGELRTALDAGFVPADCLLTGPGRSDAETEAALVAGVGLHSVESSHQLRQLERSAAATGRSPRALLRLNLPTPVRGGLRMTGKPSQFGLDPAGLALVERSLSELRHVEVVGVHVFSATNAPDEESLLAAMGAGIDAGARLRDSIDLRFLDLGGGFAAPFAAPGAAPTYPELAPRLEELLDASLPGWRDGGPEVLFESGRYLTARSGTLLCRVLDVKESFGRTFVVLDTGVHHLGGLAATGRVLAARSQPLLGDGEALLVDLVGPLCTPADVLGRDVALTGAEPGGLVALPNVGAYGLTTGLLGFLGHRPPVEVALHGDRVVSATRVLLHRTTVEEDTRVTAVE